MQKSRQYQKHDFARIKQIIARKHAISRLGVFAYACNIITKTEHNRLEVNEVFRYIKNAFAFKLVLCLE
jgi:hypothetical protein